MRLEQQKQLVQKQCEHGKKLLFRALKTAKSFERQKLSKRIKAAVSRKDDTEFNRLNAATEALKVGGMH